MKIVYKTLNKRIRMNILLENLKIYLNNWREIWKKVEETLNIYDIKPLMQARIEGHCMKLMDKITLKLQNEKQDTIQEGHA